MFGFGKEKNLRWLEIYVTEHKEQILASIKLFFESTYDELHAFIKTLDKYAEMEVQNYHQSGHSNQ